MDSREGERHMSY